MKEQEWPFVTLDGCKRSPKFCIPARRPRGKGPKASRTVLADPLQLREGLFEG